MKATYKLTFRIRSINEIAQLFDGDQDGELTPLEKYICTVFINQRKSMRLSPKDLENKLLGPDAHSRDIRKLHKAIKAAQNISCIKFNFVDEHIDEISDLRYPFKAFVKKAIKAGIDQKKIIQLYKKICDGIIELINNHYEYDVQLNFGPLYRKSIEEFWKEEYRQRTYTQEHEAAAQCIQRVWRTRRSEKTDLMESKIERLNRHSCDLHHTNPYIL